MIWNNLPRPRSTLALVTTLTLLSNSSLTAVTAQSVKALSILSFVPPKLPPQADRGAPAGRRTGGASRGGECPVPVVNKQLTALVPETLTHFKSKEEVKETLRSEKIIWGLTVDRSPILWFYIPYQLTPKLSMKLLLRDEQGKAVYDNHIRVSKTTPPGIVSFPLSATAVNLAVGKTYYWNLTIDCSDSDTSPFVDGWIKRVEPNQLSPNFASQLQKAKPQERVGLYASNGVWFNALTTLAELRSAHPEDAKLNDEWVSLLNSIGLRDIASEPIAQCCTLEKLSIGEVILLLQQSNQE